MFTVYVLHSPVHRKIYIGFTSDIKQRLLSHNELGKKGWTIKFRPWVLVHTEEYASKPDAMKREKYLKTAAAGVLYMKFSWIMPQANPAYSLLLIVFISPMGAT